MRVTIIKPTLFNAEKALTTDPTWCKSTTKTPAKHQDESHWARKIEVDSGVINNRIENIHQVINWVVDSLQTLLGGTEMHQTYPQIQS